MKTRRAGASAARPTRALTSPLRLSGAVLLLEETRAIVLRKAEQRWLRLTPRDADAALEAGYCAGNHHWKVRFEPGALLIATQGPAEHYVDRLEHLVKAGRIAWGTE
jgi:urease accessory protein